tara:strand:+ start:36 stop:722 length:687 start_codon:yes stop_codon:yes gene_type:complete
MNVNTARIVISGYAFDPNSDAFDPNSEKKEIGIQIDAFLEADIDTDKTEIDSIAQLSAIEAKLLKIGVRLNGLHHACTKLFSDGAWVVFVGRMPWNGKGSLPIVDSSLLGLVAIAFAHFYGVGHSITTTKFEDNYANVAFARQGVASPFKCTFPEVNLVRRKGEDEGHLFVPRFSAIWDFDQVELQDKDKAYRQWRFEKTCSELGCFKKDEQENEGLPPAKRVRFESK